MATIKKTFSLDEETARTLDATAKRLDWPRSQVVEEAIREFAVRLEGATEAEGKRMLELFDELVPQIPEQPAEAVEAEIAEVRKARHGGGRRSSSA